MENRITVQLLGGCVIHTGQEMIETLPQRSRKGTALMVYLILRRGEHIPAPRLIRELWNHSRNVNPENALKTMVSRLRAMLGEISPRLAACVASGQGAYWWETQPEISVDVLEVLALNDRLARDLPENERADCCRRLIELYAGDLYQPEDLMGGAAAVSRLHRIYLDAVLTLIELKRKHEAWSEILALTEAAQKMDDMDEPLQIERLRALVHLNRAAEAEAEYRWISERERRLLDAEPGEELQSFYRQISRAGTSLRYNLDVLRNRLTDERDFEPGPFFCGMDAFREFYHIQMQNLERLGSTMFLGLIMLGDGREVDPILYKGAVAGLEEILRRNLRRGDIVTRCDEYVIALLLPMVTYQSGTVVMERIEHIFYSIYPRERISFHFRITPLGGET